jgi:hypothetical protein
MLYFTKGAESGDATNWFLPNKRGFRDLVEAGGFNVEHDGDDGGGWAWLSATRGTRRFAPGLEGFSTVAEGTLSVPEGNPEVSFAAGVPSLAQVEQMRREEVLASELARVTQERNWLANQSNQWFDAAIIAIAAPAWSRAQRRRWRLFPKPSRIILGQAKRTALRKADRACKAACWAQAARFYVDALAQDPSDSAVWAQLGQTLKAAGRDAEAKFACRKSVELGA